MAQMIVVAVMAGAELMKAHARKKAKLREEAAYLEAANRTMGAATREMAAEERNKERMHSRALLLAAASGGGADDPGMVALLGDLNAEGVYRMFSRLWAGQDEAAGLRFRADEAGKEASAAMTAGVINAFSSGAKAYSGMGGFGGKAAAGSSFGQASVMEIPEVPYGAIDAVEYNPSVAYG